MTLAWFYKSAVPRRYNKLLPQELPNSMSATNGSNGNGAGSVKPRTEWITKRRDEAVRSGDTNMSQMHFARRGLLTEEMLFVAERERVAPELIRDEVAVGHMIIPANVNHPDRKSTRLNSSHLGISYAVFCLKKKNTPPSPGPGPRSEGTAKRHLLIYHSTTISTGSSDTLSSPFFFLNDPAPPEFYPLPPHAAFPI